MTFHSFIALDCTDRSRQDIWQYASCCPNVGTVVVGIPQRQQRSRSRHFQCSLERYSLLSFSLSLSLSLSLFLSVCVCVCVRACVCESVCLPCVTGYANQPVLLICPTALINAHYSVLFSFIWQYNGWDMLISLGAVLV